MKYFGDAIAFIEEGAQPLPNFESLTAWPLVIMIGLTGVGKSTVVELATKKGLDYTLLPNRRDLADQAIAYFQKEDGQPTEPVTDRIKRFEYTARYRAKFPGGMAHALSRLAIDPLKSKPILIFDGLRGLDEVQHAVTYFPKARFVVLDAPDMVRLSRLLKRSDIFDTTSSNITSVNQNLIATLMSVPDIEAVFKEEQLRQIARLARAADISMDDVVKKCRIIVEERRNYDSSTARIHLTRALRPEQVLIVDTANQTAAEVAQRMADWLRI